MDRKPIPKVFKPRKITKPMKKIGKRALEYIKWRDKVARPYLNATFGYKCAWCGSNQYLEVDHIKPRGSHPELKRDLNNVRYLCGGVEGCHGKRL